MAIADTITSMQNHTSNAYTMIGYGTDLTGINKNLENLSSTIFNAFLEALRTPDTLFTNLPKTTGSGSNITLNDTANAPMRIELGSTELSQDGTPTPSSPQTIHTISGSNKVVVNGKNLAKTTNCNVSGTGYSLVINDGDIEINTTSTNVSFDLTGGLRTGVWAQTYTQATDYHLTQADNGSYVAKLFVNQFTGTGTGNNFFTVFTNQRTLDNYFKPNATNEIKTNFTLNEGEYVKGISMWLNSGNTNSLKCNIQLEKGSTTTSYEPYISQEAEVDLGNIEYCKIGNYEDKFIRDEDGTWQLKKNIGKVVLDGTENFYTNAYITGGSVNGYQQSTALSNIALLNTDGNVGYISNYFLATSSSHWTDNAQQIIQMNDKTFLFKIDNTIAPTKNDFLTWLSSHNTTIYYVLATPTYTQITGTLETQLENIYQKLLSYTGTTNISQANNDLSFNMSILAIEDL